MFRKINQSKQVKRSDRKYFARRAMPFFTIGLILIIVVGVFTPAGFTHAQLTGNVILDTTSWLMRVSDPGTLLIGFARVVFTGILKLVSYLTWLSGYLMNYVIQYTIVDMRAHISGGLVSGSTTPEPGMPGINIAWKVIRDLMNIAFIFMLVYEGIKLIIGSSVGGSTENVKKFIIGIVLASILINFSLFFTKILIDASNLVTIGFYNSAIGPIPTGPTAEGYGLSNRITQNLGITTLYNANIIVGGDDLGGILIWGFGSGLILLITSFVFFAITLLLIIRYIALIILLMLSPIAYMGMALPFMQDYARQWWSALRSQLLFAPIFMIMTWVILTLLGSGGFTTRTGLSDVINGSTGTQPPFTYMGIVLNFAVIIGLFIASLVIAKNTSVKGSQHIGTAVGKLSTFAGGVVAGTASRVGRNTFGRAGNALSESERLKNMEVNGNFASRNFAKVVRGAGTKTATSSFDVRSTSSFGSLAKSTGIDFGKGADAKKVNFQKDREEKAKAQADYAKAFKPKDDLFDAAKIKDADKKIELKEIMASAERNKNTWDDAHKKAKDEADNLEKQIENMKKDYEASVLPDYKEKLKIDIENKQKEVEAKKKSLEELKKTADQGKEFYNKAQKEHDEYKSREEDLLKKVYTDRVEAYAKRFEDESKAWRYTKNTLKIGVGGVSGLGFTTTRGDNRKMARNIRNVLKQKTKKELAAEAALEAQKEENEQNNLTVTTPPPPPAPPPAPTT